MTARTRRGVLATLASLPVILAGCGQPRIRNFELFLGNISKTETGYTVVLDLSWRIQGSPDEWRTVDQVTVAAFLDNGTRLCETEVHPEYPTSGRTVTLDCPQRPERISILSAVECDSDTTFQTLVDNGTYWETVDRCEQGDQE